MENTEVSVQQLYEQFPDLSIFKDPKGLQRNTAGSANSQVDAVFFDVDDERRWYAFPYLEVGQWTVHSSPAYILIGRDVQSGFGVKPEPDWKEIVDANKMPKLVVKEIQEFLASKPPIDWLAGD